MLVRWMRCSVVDRDRFERGQRKWAGLQGEPGFRGQGGGWGRGSPDTAHLFGFWESRALYDSFMARSHDRLAASQGGSFRDAEVRLFEYRFDVKLGFEPRFDDADVLRVAHCLVRQDRGEHFAHMQAKVWNPAMAGSPGMLRGVFAAAERVREFLVLSMWDSAAERAKYRRDRIERLALRAQIGADIEGIAGDVIDVERRWTV
ncbi:DUF4937 domain-containing protein [Streptomyces spiramenti]|uniref:DUF4937 domain-containing protein n=1 Tax=Streptomyces spiramenti TaxID=2720606 RepID=A0ABX1AL39_9ACTN|nr:DUF4937 domain-containing protein [Streptomyces spiramenti]